MQSRVRCSLLVSRLRAHCHTACIPSFSMLTAADLGRMGCRESLKTLSHTAVTKRRLSTIALRILCLRRREARPNAGDAFVAEVESGKIVPLHLTASTEVGRLLLEPLGPAEINKAKPFPFASRVSVAIIRVDLERLAGPVDCLDSCRVTPLCPLYLPATRVPYRQSVCICGSKHRQARTRPPVIQRVNWMVLIWHPMQTLRPSPCRAVTMPWMCKTALRIAMRCAAAHISRECASLRECHLELQGRVCMQIRLFIRHDLPRDLGLCAARRQADVASLCRGECCQCRLFVPRRERV